MSKNYKQLKVWQGLVVLVSAAVVIFIVSPTVLSPFGIYGSLLAEWLMLAAALGLVLAFRGNPRELFPFRRPAGAGVFGTFLMWVGAFLIEMTLVLLVSIFFMEEIQGVNAGLSSQMMNIPFLAAVLIVAVTPAVCEEIIFRGIFFKSLKPHKYKWAAILISGVVFGAFHGDIFRFIPTAIGGVVMAWIILESGNMFYNCFFHFINNLLPIILLFGMKDVYAQLGVWNEIGYESTSIPMMSAGLYMMMCAATPACMYIGNYLLHSRTPGYRDKLFPKGKPGIVIGLIVISAVLFFCGAGLAVYGFISLQTI